jgi:hypothetical protein
VTEASTKTQSDSSVITIAIVKEKQEAAYVRTFEYFSPASEQTFFYRKELNDVE